MTDQVAWIDPLYMPIEQVKRRVPGGSEPTAMAVSPVAGSTFWIFSAGMTTARVQAWLLLVRNTSSVGTPALAVQGGLLAGAVARRRGVRDATPTAPAEEPELAAPVQDSLPVAGFLAGKLVSHTLLGAALGLLGDAVQVGFRTRAALQVTAGVVMVVLAADLLGVRAVRRSSRNRPPRGLAWCAAAPGGAAPLVPPCWGWPPC